MSTRDISWRWEVAGAYCWQSYLFHVPTLNWKRTANWLLLIPKRIWLIPSRNSSIESIQINTLHYEIDKILSRGNANKGNSFILTSLSLIILTKQFPRIVPTHLQQNKTLITHTHTNTSPTDMVKVNKMPFRKKLRADWGQEMRAVIRRRIFCLPGYYPKI